MKLLFLCIVFSSFTAISDLDAVRSDFPAIGSLEQAEKYLEILKNDESVPSTGYHAAMLFMKSKYVKFPLTKWNYFKKGKSQLDNLISENKKNVEIRYIRFLIQSEMPNFLGYNKNLEEDYLVILNEIKLCSLAIEFKAKMLHNMRLAKNLTGSKVQKINRMLTTL